MSVATQIFSNNTSQILKIIFKFDHFFLTQNRSSIYDFQSLQKCLCLYLRGLEKNCRKQKSLVELFKKQYFINIFVKIKRTFTSM